MAKLIAASRQPLAECVLEADEQLAALDQTDLDAGSTTVVRRRMRSDALARLARCEPRVRRLRRLIARGQPAHHAIPTP
jgi:hypothetical protein